MQHITRKQLFHETKVDYSNNRKIYAKISFEKKTICRTLKEEAKRMEGE